jgi:ferric-dicitrate binding protein FerR (iron transport regulator)
MKGELDWDLILKYLDGSCSTEEYQKIQDWLASDIEHQKAIDLLRKVWDTPEINLPKPDVESALLNVAETVGIDHSFIKRRTNKPIRSQTRKKKIQFIYPIQAERILRFAALVVGLLTTSYLTFKVLWPSPLREVHVAHGKQETLTLPDETRVTLDSGSYFRFPRSFQDKERTVILNGEAYFEVKEDQTKQFVIHADKAIITVLGTRFNIRAWRQNNKVIVAVADGKVSLRSDGVSEEATEVIIKKGQMSQLGEDDKPTLPESTNIDEHLAWLQQKMVFHSTPLREVLDQLERWYDLEFILADTLYAENRVTVFIERKPIDEILDMLALVNHFEYVRDGKKITFSAK